MNGQTTLSEQQVPTLTRELDSRTSDGMHIRLLWTPWTNQVHVSVVDWRRSTALHFEVALTESETKLNLSALLPDGVTKVELVDTFNGKDHDGMDSKVTLTDASGTEALAGVIKHQKSKEP